jgi:hypothetical protein
MTPVPALLHVRGLVDLVYSSRSRCRDSSPWKIVNQLAFIFPNIELARVLTTIQTRDTHCCKDPFILLGQVFPPLPIVVLEVRRTEATNSSPSTLDRVGCVRPLLVTISAVNGLGVEAIRLLRLLLQLIFFFIVGKR